jgi:hypothetical protein
MQSRMTGGLVPLHIWHAWRPASGAKLAGSNGQQKPTKKLSGVRGISAPQYRRQVSHEEAPLAQQVPSLGFWQYHRQSVRSCHVIKVDCGEACMRDAAEQRLVSWRPRASGLRQGKPRFTGQRRGDSVLLEHMNRAESHRPKPGYDPSAVKTATSNSSVPGHSCLPDLQASPIGATNG